jgi:hypothetical protein
VAIENGTGWYISGEALEEWSSGVLDEWILEHCIWKQGSRSGSTTKRGLPYSITAVLQ